MSILHPFERTFFVVRIGPDQIVSLGIDVFYLHANIYPIRSAQIWSRRFLPDAYVSQISSFPPELPIRNVLNTAQTIRFITQTSVTYSSLRFVWDQPRSSWTLLRRNVRGVCTWGSEQKPWRRQYFHSIFCAREAKKMSQSTNFVGPIWSAQNFFVGPSNRKHYFLNTAQTIWSILS